MNMESMPASQEQKPNSWESVEKHISLTAEEKEICATCTHENREALIAWYIREQEEASKDPTGRKSILLDIRAGCMQYIIAKDMEQRGEAYERLLDAKDRALGEGMPDLGDMVTRAMDMFEAV